MLRCASFSCNNMTCEDNPCVWDDLRTKLVETDRVDLLLMMGDQVYADVAFAQGKAMLDKPHMWSAELHEQLVENYRRVYRQTWAYEPTRRVLSQVPSVCIWDDHDVRNDWGSHATDRDRTCDVYKVGLAARDAFWEYQRQLWDDVCDPASGRLRADLRDSIKGDFHSHRFGDFGIFVLDTRGSRSFYSYVRTACSACSHALVFSCLYVLCVQ